MTGSAIRPATALLFAVLGIAACRAEPRATRHRVIIRDLRFAPAELTVARGDTVAWTNDDIVPHTVTAADGSWESGDLPPGATFTWVATGSGAVGYACRYHPGMTASLVRR